MDTCDSISHSQSLTISSMEDSAGNKNQTGTSVNINISASGGNWTQMNQVEEKPLPTNINDEIEDLLSAPVSKDYINCVWTCEPDADDQNASIGNNLSTEDTTLNNCESSNQSESLGQIPVEKTEPPKSPAIIRWRKRRKKRKITTDQGPAILQLFGESNTSKAAGIESFGELENSEAAGIELCEEPKNSNTAGISVFEEPKNANNPGINVFEASNTSKAAGIKLFGEAKNSQAAGIKLVEESKNSQAAGIKFFVESKNSNAAGKELGSNLGENQISQDEVDAKKVETKLFSAYKQFVKSQPVPPYLPIFIDSRFTAENVYVCKGCGDKFVLEMSLLGHTSRKTGRLIFKCIVCQDHLCFYNRCSFLIHIRSHDFDPSFFNDGDLRVLPLEDEENEFDALFKTTSLHLLRCAECSQMVDSMKLHFERGSTLESENAILICELCGYVSPSKCAASAHNRFHKREPPFLCPDCGETFLNSLSLLGHIKNYCHHDLKRTEFNCCCSIVFQSIDEFFGHLITQHVRTVYRCHICKTTSRSVEDFQSHRMAEHNLHELDFLSALFASSTLIECDLCPGTLFTVASVEDHASFHTTHSLNLLTVFRCDQCERRFASKALVIDHIPSCQGSKDSAFNNNNSIIEGDLSKTLESTPTGQDSLAKGPLVPSECVSTSDNDCFNSVIQIEKSELTPINDTMPEEKREEDSEVKTDIPVSLTNVQPFKKGVVCKICRKVVSVEADKVLIKRHFSSEHFDIYMNAIHREVNGQLTHPAEDYVMKSDQEIVDSFLKSFTNKDDVPKIRSKKRNVKKSMTRNPKVNAKNGKTGFKARKLGPVKTVKKCYKCSFSSKDLRAFRSHIILHKSNASELQCPECGLCFIVRPPLEKHLIAGHGIKNVGKYLSDNGFEDHESEVELSDNEDQIVNVESDSEVLQENQCKVCKEIFESAMLLEKHFRVHGGAFLLASMKAKRLSL